MDTSDDTDKIKTLRSRSRAPSAPLEDCQDGCVASPPRPAQSEVANPRSAFARVVRREDAGPPGTLLPFPLRGEALLVKLADELRDRFTDGALSREPLSLTMSRCPESRLSIDRDAYVEFHADLALYHVAIETAPDTRIMLDTTNFDTAVNFVAHYIAGRLPAPEAML